MWASLPLAVALTLGAGGRIDVVLSRVLETNPERARDVVERTAAALGKAKLGDVVAPADSVKRLVEAKAGSPEACAAKRPCLAKLGQTLGSRVLIGVDVGHVADQMAIVYEAVNPADGARLVQHRFTVPTAAYPAGFDLELSRLIERLKEAMIGLERDAPLAAVAPPPLTPAPAAPPPVVDVAPKPLPLPALALTAGAVATAAVAVALTVMGAGAQGQLDAARYTSPSGPASHLTQVEAQKLASTANTDFTGAVACASASALLTGAAIWMWTHPRETP